MGFRFYRRAKLFPGVSLNFSKSGASVSFGGRGARITIGPKGIRKTVGIPGTGMYYTENAPYRNNPSVGPGTESASNPLGLFLILIVVIVVVFIIFAALTR